MNLSFGLSITIGQCQTRLHGRIILLEPTREGPNFRHTRRLNLCEPGVEVISLTLADHRDKCFDLLTGSRNRFVFLAKIGKIARMPGLTLSRVGHANTCKLKRREWLWTLWCYKIMLCRLCPTKFLARSCLKTQVMHIALDRGLSIGISLVHQFSPELTRTSASVIPALEDIGLVWVEARHAPNEWLLAQWRLRHPQGAVDESIKILGLHGGTALL